MEFNAIQIILVAVWSFIVAIDQFDLLESLYQPIVSGAVVGAILGDLQTGLIVGGTYQLMYRCGPTSDGEKWVSHISAASASFASFAAS